MSKPICPECNSKNILHRKKGDMYRCRICGEEWGRKKSKLQEMMDENEKFLLGEIQKMRKEKI